MHSKCLQALVLDIHGTGYIILHVILFIGMLVSVLENYQDDLLFAYFQILLYLCIKVNTS